MIINQDNIQDAQSKFETHGFVFLESILEKKYCDILTEELRKAVSQGQTTKDPQCPLSEAIYGLPAFDRLLEELTPLFEAASGKKLFPSYTYARLYLPGEELKFHSDRPSCEISATLTLNFDGDVWPIYIGEFCDENDPQGKKFKDKEKETSYTKNIAKVEMQPGDALFYKGVEKPHWREPYTQGKWQAQVFLHYVDANGEFADFKYDKRPCLSHHYQPPYQQISNPVIVNTGESVTYKTQLERDDIIVVKVKDTNPQVIKDIQAVMNNTFPNQKVIVIDNSIDIEIIKLSK